MRATHIRDIAQAVDDATDREIKRQVDCWLNSLYLLDGGNMIVDGWLITAQLLHVAGYYICSLFLISMLSNFCLFVVSVH